jgi:hypothetical protein
MNSILAKVFDWLGKTHGQVKSVPIPNWLTLVNGILILWCVIARIIRNKRNKRNGKE